MPSISFVVPKTYVYFNPQAPLTPGGAERQAYLLGTFLAENPDFQVNYCVNDVGQADCETYDKIKVWKAFNSQDNKIVQFFKLYKTLKKINADWYIFRSADLGVAVGILLVKWILRKKVLYMVANSEEPSHQGLIKLLGKKIAYSMGFIYPKVDALSVQSEQQYTDFQRFRKMKPTEIIRNIYLVNSEKIKEIDRNFTLWVGRCDHLKQPEKLIALAQQFPKEKFVMVCPPTHDKHYYQIILEQIRKTPNIQHIEFLPNTELKKLYFQAKIYTITSLSEGFANTMLEAMEAQCPILSLNINPDQILEKFNLGLCAMNNDMGLLFQHFDKLLENRSLREEMGTNGLKYLLMYHSPESVLKSFIFFEK